MQASSSNFTCDSPVKKGTSCTRWAPSPVVSFFRSTIYTGENKKTQVSIFFLGQFIGAPIYTSIYNDRIGGPPWRRKYFDAFIPSDLVIWNDILVDSLGFRNDGINPGIIKTQATKMFDLDVAWMSTLNIESYQRTAETTTKSKGLNKGLLYTSCHYFQLRDFPDDFSYETSIEP